MGFKVGVISDTHLNSITAGFRDLYESYLKDSDLICHAGDLVSLEVADFFKDKDFHGVHGNMDPLEVRNSLPAKEILEVGSYRIGLIHGWGPPDGIEDRIVSEFKGVDVIIYGHSHRPVNHEKKGILFFNPGTATGFSRTKVHSIGILDVGDTIKGDLITLS